MLAAAVALAFTYWGTPPCPVHVVPLEPGVLGQAWTAPRCEVQIRAGRWRWWKLCSTLVHEAGHTAGLGHSEDRLSPMFGELVRTAEACRGRRPDRFPSGYRVTLR